MRLWRSVSLRDGRPRRRSSHGVGFLEFLIALLVAPAVIVTSFFALEIAAGLRRNARYPAIDARAPGAAPRGRTVIVVPAHDEEGVIGEAISRLKVEAEGVAEILIVADNCRDGTARAAQECGVEVVERHDETRRGKGFALAFAQAHLAKKPPAVVVVLDADCFIDKDSLRLLAATAEEHGRPCQSVNLLRPSRGTPLVAVSTFAFMLKNLVRQRGLQRLAGSVHLAGTGMAFPWTLFDHDRLATSSIVEDVKLGVELTSMGKGPMLVPAATVWSNPSSAAGTLVQRTRWEGGYIALALEVAPKLLRHAFATLDPRALCRGLDLCVPPVALLAVLNLAILTVAIALTITASVSWWPVTLLLVALSAAALAVLFAWWREGRKFISVGQLACVPFYIMWKLPLYLGMRRRGSTEWLRTGR